MHTYNVEYLLVSTLLNFMSRQHFFRIRIEEIRIDRSRKSEWTLMMSRQVGQTKHPLHLLLSHVVEKAAHTPAGMETEKFLLKVKMT